MDKTLLFSSCQLISFLPLWIKVMMKNQNNSHTYLYTLMHKLNIFTKIHTHTHTYIYTYRHEYIYMCIALVSLVVQTVKNLPVMQKTRVQSLGQEGPLENGMATHSSILAWRISWTEEPGRLQSTESHRVRHNWTTNTFSLSSTIYINIYKCPLLGIWSLIHLFLS